MKHDISPFNAIISTSTSLEPVYRPDLTQIRGRLTLIDNSLLYIRENHILSNSWIDYAYHWQTADHQLIHHWDNAHPVDLPTSPHHQHIGSEEKSHPSEPMTLEKVLTYIATTLLRQ